MRNPDRFPAETSADLAHLRETYPTPESMAEDFANRAVSWAEVTERFPDESDHELVEQLAEKVGSTTPSLAMDEAVMDPIQQRVHEEIEQTEGDLIEYIVEQFPPELHDRIYEEIDDFDDARAIDYLTTKLINRRYAMGADTARELAQMGVEVVKEYPRAIAERIAALREEGEDVELGHGKNGEVISSIGQPGTCYKVLFLERAKVLASTAGREALLQYQASEILKDCKDCAQAPQVLRYVDHKDLRAIHMQEVEGVTLKDILDEETETTPPEGFDVDDCMAQLKRSVELLNERGVFHRDILGNAGNIMIDKNGKPWLIDYGSAIKSAAADHDGRTYQISAGGKYIVGNDKAGVQNLERQLRALVKQYEGIGEDE